MVSENIQTALHYVRKIQAARELQKKHFFALRRCPSNDHGHCPNRHCQRCWAAARNHHCADMACSGLNDDAAKHRKLLSIFHDHSPWNWIKVGRQFIQFWHSNKHLIANFNRQFLSVAFTISLCLPLEFICPIFVASRLIKNSPLAA